MKLLRKVGSTSQILQVFIQDTSSATGAGLTGLVFNSSGLVAYYHRDTDTTATAISLVTMTVGTFTSGGFRLVDDSNMPGVYQLCIPNAAIASGASSVVVTLQGAANMAPLVLEIDLDAQVDVTHWNGTAVKTPTVAGVVESRLTGTCTQGASDMLIRCGTTGTVPPVYVTCSGTDTPAVYMNATGTGASPALKLESQNHNALLLRTQAGTNSVIYADHYGTGSILTLDGFENGANVAPVVQLYTNSNQDGIKVSGSAAGTGKDINLAGSQSIAGYLTGVASPTFVGPGVQAELAASTDSFQCGVSVIDDNGGTTDRWGVRFFKNGQSIATGQATLATLTVTDLTTGVALFTAASLTERAGGVFYYNEATNRIVSGRAYSAVATWTDDAAVRSWPNVVGRDST